MIDRKTFQSLLSKRFYPVLRDEGFKGSGNTLRRINGKVIHVFNFQGSSSGNQGYLNMGVHLSFLPAERGVVIQSEKIEEPDCIFRKRIIPPPGPQFGWSYCSSIEEASENVEFIVSEWPSQGRIFYDRYSTYPESFKSIISQSVPSELHPRECLHYARIAVELGLSAQACEYSKSGLERAGERATILRSSLKETLIRAGKHD